MARAHFEIVCIVSRRDLHRARAEFRIDTNGIGDDWNLDARNRQGDRPAYQLSIVSGRVVAIVMLLVGSSVSA